jgi:2,4-dienoyl-CoA reductase-like NADH-dependent reductase (Old Yellow Enzyme family)
MSKLFEKVVLNNNVEIKNRLVIAPLTLFSSNPDGTLNDEEREYLKLRATDIGLYILGATSVDQQGLTFENQPRAMNEKDLPSLTERANIIKNQGAKAIIQLHHGGNEADKMFSGIDPVIIDKLTNQEINKIIEDFGNATELSIKSGHDGIEIHGASGYLCQQFYSRHFNHRKDEWGGSDEKRMNFALKVIDACCKVRDKYNRPDFIIGYRITPEEPYKDGLTMTECIKFVKELVKKPLQYLHIYQSYYFRKAYNGETAGQERLKVIHNLTKGKVALIGCGGLKSEADFKSAVKSGYSEFIAAGMASMMNRDLGILLKEGKGDKIEVEIDPKHPERYAMPPNLWKMCFEGISWFPPLKRKSHK